jgi:RNA polymerase sigma factor (sigma-70 family)
VHEHSQLDDWLLLRAYVEEQSEAAFETLVRRYAGHVYAIALRRIGNPHLAQDVTQAVFLLLVRKAPTFSKDAVLLGWLTNTARFVSQTAIRGERRRSDRELAAMNDPSLNSEAATQQWEELGPQIDEAIGALNEKDRNVILLRFYQKKSVEDVGKAIGSGEAAAQKRITRAIEKLRKFLTRRGVTISSVSLVGLISANASQAAPPQIVDLVLETSLNKGGASLSPSLSALVDKSVKAMVMKSTIKITLALAASLAVTAPITALVLSQKWNETIHYDLSGEFLSSENPKGVWAYGWIPDLNGPFRPLQYRKKVPVQDGVLIESWQLGPSINPAIYRNSGSQTWDNGQGVFPPGAVWYHAGENNRPQNFGVVRFTVPHKGGGVHTVKVAVSPHFHPRFAGDTDFHVTTNGTVAISRFLDTRSGLDWSASFRLSEGDTIDFCVGRGMDQDGYASGLKIQLSIEAPKPQEEREG